MLRVHKAWLAQGAPRDRTVPHVPPGSPAHAEAQLHWDKIEPMLNNVFQKIFAGERRPNRDIGAIYTVCWENPFRAVVLTAKLRDWMPSRLWQVVVATLAADGDVSVNLAVVEARFKAFTHACKFAFDCGGFDAAEFTVGYAKFVAQGAVLFKVRSMREGQLPLDAANVATLSLASLSADGNFQVAYIDAVRQYYEAREPRELDGHRGGSVAYLAAVKSCHELESSLFGSDAPPLLKQVLAAVSDAMIVPHAARIVGVGGWAAFWLALSQDPAADAGDSAAANDVVGTYQLLKEAPSVIGMGALGAAIRASIVDIGKEGATAYADGDGSASLNWAFVSRVAELDGKLSALITDRCGNDTKLHLDRAEGFKTLLRPEVRLEEVFAEHCHSVLLNGTDTDGDDTAAEVGMAPLLKSLARLVPHLANPNAFADTCKMKLAQRLLTKAPRFLEAEWTFLEVLRQATCGSFTHKMAGMLDDVAASKELTTEFSDRPDAHTTAACGVKVLCGTHWPAFMRSTLVPPESLQRCMDAFTVFYTRRQPTTTAPRRTLTWLHTLGSVDVRVGFSGGAKSGTLSVFQAAVLLAVDRQPAISVADIAGELGIDTSAVKRQVASMLLTLLETTTKKAGTTIFDTDRFAINAGFTHKQRRFRVPAAPPRCRSPEQVARDDVQIDAAVVRIMKQRGSVGLSELQELVARALSPVIVPEPARVVQRVEELLDREYLRRSESDRGVFEYVA